MVGEDAPGSVTIQNSLAAERSRVGGVKQSFELSRHLGRRELKDRVKIRHFVSPH
jgi:hypothetical protein